jgi:hypothetical protein
VTERAEGLFARGRRLHPGLLPIEGEDDFDRQGPVQIRFTAVRCGGICARFSYPSLL